MRKHLYFRAVVLAGLFSLTSVGSAAAQGRADRIFTYTYQSSTLPAEDLEFDQWFTWETDTDLDATYDRVEFRHELKYGLTDDWQGSFFLSDWSSQRGASVEDTGGSWDDVAFQTIYALSDADVDAIGSALFGEVKVGNDFCELEGKAVLQFNFDKAVIAYNATFAREWQNSDEGGDTNKFNQTLGMSYGLHRVVNLGLELLHSVESEEGGGWGDNAIYLGPALGLHEQRWWAAVSPMMQASTVKDEPNLMIRALLGVRL